MTTTFRVLEEASVGADTSALGTASLGAGGVTVAEGAEIWTSSAREGVIVETAGAERGSVETLGFTEKAAWSVEISVGRVESTSMGGISGASWRGGVRFGAGGD